MTHPPNLWLAETAIWWGSSKPYNAGRLWVTVVESLDWTIVEVTLGPDSQRPVHRPCELKCCERTPEDKTYDIYLTHGRVQWEGLRCGTTRSWDLGRDLGWPMRSPMGRLTLWDNGKLGLRCIDQGKKHNLGWPRSPMGRLTLWDNGKLGLGVQIWDGWCCERTLDELPTDGLRNAKVYVIYMCSTETVLSTELSQVVTKELVTNGLTFNLWIPVTGPR